MQGLDLSKRLGQPEAFPWGKPRVGYTPERGSYVGRGHGRLQLLPLPCDPLLNANEIFIVHRPMNERLKDLAGLIIPRAIFVAEGPFECIEYDKMSGYVTILH